MSDLLHMLILATVLLFASNIWLIVRVLRPLQQLAAGTTRLESGDFKALQRPCGGIPEIDRLRHSMTSMVAHVRRAQEESYQYRNALLNGQEAERTRIAHELHDDTVQSLVAIGQSIDLARNSIVKDSSQADVFLKAARSQVVESVNNLRRLIADLRPPALEELGLVAALRMLSTGTSASQLTVQAEGTERRLDEAQELALFRCAQEAVHNALHHSRASHIQINVTYEREKTRLSIHDDGAGFAVSHPFNQLGSDGHFGLLGIDERIHSLNGTVEVKSTVGQGTNIFIEVPYDAQHQPTGTVRDPVCSAIIQPNQAYGNVTYQDETYYFCCPVCQGAFQKAPEMYVHAVEQPGA